MQTFSAFSKLAFLKQFGVKNAISLVFKAQTFIFIQSLLLGHGATFGSQRHHFCGAGVPQKCRLPALKSPPTQAAATATGPAAGPSPHLSRPRRAVHRRCAGDLVCGPVGMGGTVPRCWAGHVVPDPHF